MTDVEQRQLRDELREIESTIMQMGASREYCLNYFMESGGCCDRVVNGQCMRHSIRQAPLPEGKMCSIEFSKAAFLLRKQIARVEDQRCVCRQEWDQLKSLPACDDPRTVCRKSLIFRVYYF